MLCSGTIPPSAKIVGALVLAFAIGCGDDSNPTPDGGAQFRVRFSYEIGSTGAYTCSGWNVDDIVLTEVCN